MKARAIIILALAAIIGFWFYKNPPDILSTSNISGTIDLNGPVPQGATIAIATREVGGSQFDVVVTDIVPQNGSQWVWRGAKKGESYQIEAHLEKDGVNITSSEPITVAAPATEEVLVLNVHNPSDKTAEISGYIDVNGPPPKGTSVSIVQRTSSAEAFTEIISGIPAEDKRSWVFSNAKEGQTYEIKALVELNDTDYGESQNVLKVSAPATDEVLKIHFVTPTQAPQPGSPTPKPTGISGNINLNGSIPSNTSISLGQRITGQNTFNIVQSNIQSQNGVSWSWNGATPGTSYDIQAYLIQSGQNIASSNIFTAPAPAANEVLTINYGSANLPVPPNSPGVNCLSQGGSNNYWNSNISYHSVNGAQNYWIIITDSNNNQLYNQQIPPNNQQLPTTYNFNTQNLFQTGLSYFVKYAYSTCGNCNNSWDYSPFTPTTQFSCNTPSVTPQPTNTPPPQPTNTPIPPTSPPKPTNTPTPTLPPRTSACNQTCGSNGYTCVVGLQCATGSLPGSQVCRNPNCPDRPDCECN